MNKRFTLSFLLLLSFLLSATAQSIDEARAKRIAASFFKSNAARSMRGKKWYRMKTWSTIIRLGSVTKIASISSIEARTMALSSFRPMSAPDKTCWAIRREAAWIIVPVLLTSRLSSIGMRKVSACLSRRMEARAAQPLPTKTQ